MSSEGSCSSDDDTTPKFNMTDWNPEPPAGLCFISLLPFNQGYSLASDEQQESAPGKLMQCQRHRKARRAEYEAGHSVGRNIRDERKLKHAVEIGDSMTAATLIQDGVNPSCCDDKQRTPLHIAAAKGDEQMVSLLLDSGANPNQKDVIGNTPLHLAACSSCIKVVTLLLKAGTDVNALDHTGRTPLHLATGRLRLLHSSNTYTHTQLKNEVTNIIDMMKEYLTRSSGMQLDELENITQRLQSTSTKEEIDELNDLLSNFASLQLTKPPSTDKTYIDNSAIPPAMQYFNPR